MPPPVPKWSWPSSNQNVRMATLRSPRAAVGVDPADRAAVDAARRRLERGDVVERGELGRAGDRAGREGGVDRVGPAEAGPQPALDRATRGGRGRGAARRRTAPAPGPSPTRTPVRGRCARGRRSSRSRPGPWGGGRSAVAAVPLMGDDQTRSPSRDRNRSGEAEATWTPWAGSADDRAERRRVALGERGAERGDVGVRRAAGVDSRRVRLTWYTSPAAIASRIERDARLERRPGRGSMVHVASARPATAAPATVGPDGRGAKRAHTGRPVEREDDRPAAPAPSSAARSEVTSTRSVSSRSPTTASAGPIHGRHPGSYGAPTGPDGRRHGSDSRRRTIAAYARVRGLRADRRAGGVPQGRARLRRRRDRAARRGLGPRPHLPGRHRAGHGRARACSACRSPRSTAGRGADFTTLCVAIEELGPGRPVAGHHARGRRRPRRQPDLPRSAPRSSASAGCPTCAPAGRSAGSASPSPRPAATPAAPAPAPSSTRPRASG